MTESSTMQVSIRPSHLLAACAAIMITMVATISIVSTSIVGAATENNNNQSVNGASAAPVYGCVDTDAPADKVADSDGSQPAVSGVLGRPFGFGGVSQYNSYSKSTTTNTTTSVVDISNNGNTDSRFSGNTYTDNRFSGNSSSVSASNSQTWNNTQSWNNGNTTNSGNTATSTTTTNNTAVNVSNNGNTTNSGNTNNQNNGNDNSTTVNDNDVVDVL